MSVQQIRILVKPDGTEVLQEYAPYWITDTQRYGWRWQDVPKVVEPSPTKESKDKL